MNQKLEDLKNKLRSLSEPGAIIELSVPETEYLEVSNVYDLMEESEVTNG